MQWSLKINTDTLQEKYYCILGINLDTLRFIVIDSYFTFAYLLVAITCCICKYYAKLNPNKRFAINF